MVWKFGTLCHMLLQNLERLKNLRGKVGVGLLKVILLGYVSITSVKFNMWISYIFGNTQSEVLWQIERAPVLAEDLTRAISALKCCCWLSFLSVFNSTFLNEKCKTKLYFVWLYVKFKVFNPFRCATFLYPLKTSENSNAFCCFQGVGEKCLGIGSKLKLLNQFRCK